MSTNVPDDPKCLALARIIENLSGQVQALVDAGGREPERAPDHLGCNSIVGKNMVPDGLTRKTGVRQTMEPALQIGGKSRR